MRSFTETEVFGFHVYVLVIIRFVDEAEERRIERIDVFHIGLLRDFAAGEMDHGIDNQSPKIFVNKVQRRASGCAEGMTCFAIWSGVRMQPCEWLHGLVAVVIDEYL